MDDYEKGEGTGSRRNVDGIIKGYSKFLPTRSLQANFQRVLCQQVVVIEFPLAWPVSRMHNVANAYSRLLPCECSFLTHVPREFHAKSHPLNTYFGLSARQVWCLVWSFDFAFWNLVPNDQSLKIFKSNSRSLRNERSKLLLYLWIEAQFVVLSSMTDRFFDPFVSQKSIVNSTRNLERKEKKRRRKETVPRNRRSSPSLSE